MNIDERIKLANKFKRELVDNNPYGVRKPDEIIKLCDVLKAFGYEWGNKKVRIGSFGRIVLNSSDLHVVKGKPYITNRATGYEFDDDEYYVVWDNGNIGRLQFVCSDFYSLVEDEWEEFERALDSYCPLEYDPLNNYKVFSVENGKRLSEDYSTICNAINEKMEVKIQEKKLADAKAEYERLLDLSTIPTKLE